MHNAYVRVSAQWPPETVLTPVDLRRFDVAQFQALKTAGGSWTPLTPVTIGGQGLFLVGVNPVGHFLSGGVATASGGRVVLGASIYPTFAVSVAREIQWPIVVPGYASVAPAGTVFSQVAIGALAWPIAPRQLHNGAAIATANVTLAVGQKHLVTPASLPTVTLVRSDWAPWVQATWAPSTVYVGVHAIVIPTTANGRVFVSAGAMGGTSAAVEPDWAAASGVNQSITDESVLWVNCGYSAQAPAWSAATAYAVGALVQPTPTNGLVYVCNGTSGTGTSGAVQPNFPLTPGAQVLDNPGVNQVVWICIGTPRAASWTANTAYKENVYVTASNGLYYYAREPGTSGATEPAWGTVVGGNTLDGSGSFAWVCVGSNPIGAGSLPTPASVNAYYADGVPQTMPLACAGATTIDTAHYSYALILTDEEGIGAFQWVTTTTWLPTTSYVATLLGHSYVQPNPANGLLYECVAGGETDSEPPAWPLVIGATVTESGGPTWACVGPAAPSQNIFLSVAFAFTIILDMRPE